jgi:hypothetical protein
VSERKTGSGRRGKNEEEENMDKENNVKEQSEKLKRSGKYTAKYNLLM